jgi:hypothetical protein
MAELVIVRVTPANSAGRKATGSDATGAWLILHLMGRAAFGNAVFAAHRRSPNLQKGWILKFSI